MKERRVSMLRNLLCVLVLGSAAVACSGAVFETPDGVLPTDAGGDSSTSTPYLTALGVQGYPPVTLTPSFSPEVFDYYVRCTPGTTSLLVSMNASPGASSALLRPTTTAPSPQQSVNLSVRENEAIVATATAGKITTEYWVRCLPADFPLLEMERHPELGAPPPGYYLLGNSEPPAGNAGYAMVLDGNGVPVWYFGRKGTGIADVDDVVSGAVSFVPSFEALPFEIHHLDTSMTSYAAPSGTALDTHELRVLPNGDYIVISDPITTGVDLTGVHVVLPGGEVHSFGPSSSIVDCVVVEFEPMSGKVVWSWVGSQHFEPKEDLVVPMLAEEPDSEGPVVDAFHCNSVDVDPANGNLLVSARNMDSVFYIDKETGKVLWKMGGFLASKDGAQYVPVQDAFYEQHDARIQSWSSACGGKGQISVFDDHSSEPGPARGLVLDVVVGSGAGEDCAAPNATVAWQYSGKTNSSTRGSFRISADGSRVICWGDSAQRGFIFTEVDAEGHDLLDFHFPDGNVSYRTIKAPLSAFDLDVLRSTAGQAD
jgi:hypothetical protein